MFKSLGGAFQHGVVSYSTWQTHMTWLLHGLQPNGFVCEVYIHLYANSTHIVVHSRLWGYSL
jgi:hypothetical protein